MALTCESALSLLLDAALDTVTEPGHGSHIRPRDVDWVATNITRTSDWRAFLLTPLQRTAGWQTTTTAATPYARPRLAAYTQTAGTWTEREWYAAGNWWMCLQGTTGTLTTGGTTWTGGASGNVQANASIHVDAWLYGAHAPADVVLSTTFGNGRFRLDVTGTGYGILYDLDADPDARIAEGQLTDSNATHEPVRFLIWPAMRRHIYVFGTGGREIVWTDKTFHPEVEDRTDPSATTPLCPAGPVVVQAYRRVVLQVTETAFPDTGSLNAQVSLPYAPLGVLSLIDKESNSLSWKDTPTGAACTLSTPGWDAENPTETLVVNAAFAPTADKHFTPALYAAGFTFAPVTGSRTAVQGEVITSVLSDGFRLDADEERTTLTVPFRDAVSLRAANNRIAVLTTADGDEILRGYAIDPQTPALDTRDACIVTVVDEWDRLDGTLLPNTHQFDGMLLTDTVKYILEYCGIPEARWEIEASDFRLPPKSMNGEGGDSDALIQPGTGQSAGEFLRYLRDTYSSRRMHFASVGGTVKFVFQEEATLMATPQVALYTTTAAAVTAGKNNRYTVRDWQSQVQRPEANEAWAIGRDPSGAWLYAPYIDTVSQDPTVAEASRNSRWLGERRVVILIDPSLSTQEEVNAACSFLAAKTVWAIESATFTSEWHPQVQRFNALTVDGVAYRVRDYGVDIIREQGTAFGRFRPCQYRVERALYDE